MAIDCVGIAEYTYYRWRKQNGQIPKDGGKRLKELEHENARLKRLLACLSDVQPLDMPCIA